jgi:hypothetical protein
MTSALNCAVGVDDGAATDKEMLLMGMLLK